MRPALFFRALPDFRLLDAETDEYGKYGGQAAEHKQRTPTPGLKQGEEADGGEEVAGGVPLLQQSRKNPAETRRNFFHGQRCAHAPFAAHADPKERAQYQKGRVVGSESRKDLD